MRTWPRLWPRWRMIDSMRLCWLRAIRGGPIRRIGFRIFSADGCLKLASENSPTSRFIGFPPPDNHFQLANLAGCRAFSERTVWVIHPCCASADTFRWGCDSEGGARLFRAAVSLAGWNGDVKSLD